MADIAEMIRRDVEDDVTIKVHGLIVDAAKKGFLVKKQVLTISGTVANEHERDKIVKIANHHAGKAYDFDIKIQVKSPEKA